MGELIIVKVDVQCSRCKKQATITEDEAQYTSAWVKVILEPPRVSEHTFVGRPKQTCLCLSCAMTIFPELYPMEMRQE